MGPWTESITALIFAISGYLLIELNTAFSLIRIRTTIHVSLYWLMTSVCIFLHPLSRIVFIPLLFIVAMFYLFRSYESEKPSFNIFSSFFFLSIGSILFPSLIYFTPLIFISMISFRCMTVKSFCAGLTGILTPYWFLFAYSFLYDRMDIFYEPLIEMIKFSPSKFTTAPTNQLVSGCIILALSVISTIDYLFSSYLDKTKIRMFFLFIIYIEIWNFIIWFLQPQYIIGAIQIQIICYSLLTGHMFALTKNRFSSTFLVITFVIITLLAIYNIWTQFFSFF